MTLVHGHHVVVPAEAKVEVVASGFHENGDPWMLTTITLDAGPPADAEPGTTGSDDHGEFTVGPALPIEPPVESATER